MKHTTKVNNKNETHNKKQQKKYKVFQYAIKKSQPNKTIASKVCHFPFGGIFRH